MIEITRINEKNTGIDQRELRKLCNFLKIIFNKIQRL